LAMQVLVVRVSRQVVGTKPQPTQMWRDVVRGDDRQYSKGGWPFEGRLVAVPLYGIRGTGRELRQVVMCHHPCVEQKFMRRRDDPDAWGIALSHDQDLGTLVVEQPPRVLPLGPEPLF